MGRLTSSCGLDAMRVDSCVECLGMESKLRRRQHGTQAERNGTHIGTSSTSQSRFTVAVQITLQMKGIEQREGESVLWPSHKHSLGGGRLTEHVNINTIELLGGGALHASQKKRRDGRQTEILPSPPKSAFIPWTLPGPACSSRAAVRPRSCPRKEHEKTVKPYARCRISIFYSESPRGSLSSVRGIG
jgi:hypothetical protein